MNISKLLNNINSPPYWYRCQRRYIIVKIL